jgi:hopanoid biosynthesis associated RND transporter like protein HpnN
VSRLEGVLGETLAAVVARSARRPALTLAVALLLALGSLFYASGNLGVMSDTDELFDSSLPFRRLRIEIEEALPARRDALLVVIDAPSDILAEQVAQRLVERLRAEPERFAAVWSPGVGDFFDRNGLLYLERSDLEELTDTLASVQPFIAEVQRDPSLRGVLGPLTKVVERSNAPNFGDVELVPVFDGLASVVRDARRLRSHPDAFGDLIVGASTARGSPRSFLIVSPVIDYQSFVPGGAAVDRLREIFAEEALEPLGVRARITGDLALKVEELVVVRGQAATAGIASFLSVALILWLALGSIRLIAGSIAMLLAGLSWTAGFAALAVGHLNIISVAFAVLFIGLAVDFSIHFCLRYQELRVSGVDHEEALLETSRGVGGSLALCAATTAVGFYAFVPTGYRGVSELGVISGTGMLLALVSNMTVLPAVLSLGLREPGGVASARSWRLALPTWPVRHPVQVCAVAVVLAALAAGLAPRLRFDANPLNVRDPTTESLQTFQELIEGGDINPWSIEVLAPDLDSARELALELEKLPSVESAATLASYVPDDQREKLLLVEDLALFLVVPALESLAMPSPEQEREALRSFQSAVQALADDPSRPALAPVARRLTAEVDAFLTTSEEQPEAISALQGALVDSLRARLDRLERALAAREVGLADLPSDLRSRMQTEGGRSLVEVLPAGDLTDDAAVDRFVREVRSVTDRATGASVYMFESARAIVAALQQALVTAALLIAVLLWVLWRSARASLLALSPLLLAALLTAAACVLIGLPINFADVIVVPLLLGIGVDSAIHLVHRHRGHEGAADSLLETSTPRAILWSALTTIASFGSLAFATHLGMATLGQLLTLGVAITLGCNLFVLPALLVLADRSRR